MSEIAHANWSETPANNNAASPNGWTSTTMLPSGVEPTAREMMSALKKWWNRSNAVKVSAGLANQQTLTYDVAEAQYYTGQCFAFIVGLGLTNTGSTTLNVSGLGAKTIKISATNLRGGELQPGMAALVCYDGTNMQLLAAGGRLAAGGTFDGNPGDPFGTISNTAVMMGLGSTCTITPRKSGVVRLSMDFSARVFAANAGWTGGLRIGTGAAPANGDAAAGSAIGVAKTVVIPDTAYHVMSLSSLQSSMTIGTAYWFDLAVGNVSGTDLAAVAQIHAEAVEI